MATIALENERPNSLDTPRIANEHREIQMCEDGAWSCECRCCMWLRRRELSIANHEAAKEKQTVRIQALAAFGIKAEEGECITDVQLNAGETDKLIRLLKRLSRT